MDDERKSALKKVDRLLRQMRTSIDPNVPTQLVQAFLTVALHEGASLTEIAEKLGSGMSTVSRHLLDLGERNRKMTQGYGLVARATDPMELRKNHYSLTPKGRLFADSLVQTMND